MRISASAPIAPNGAIQLYNLVWARTLNLTHGRSTGDVCSFLSFEPTKGEHNLTKSIYRLRASFCGTSILKLES